MTAPNPRSLYYNAKRIKDRDTQVLLGILRGILADNLVNGDEFIYLDTWLTEHQEITETWAGKKLWDRMAEILQDGVIDPHELEDLKETIEGVLGGHFDDSIDELAAPQTPELVFDKDDWIDYDDRKFVLTGQFVCCSRHEAESRVTRWGGQVMRAVSGQVDYVIVGALADPSWIHGNYGRKIEKALELREQGKPIKIVHEKTWSQD